MSANPTSWCSRHSLPFAASFVVVAAFSLWLRSGFPVQAAGYAQHDDLLFIRLALSLGSGRWLGAYDNLTLAKGMIYPLFISLSFLSGLPLKISEHLVYMAAAGALSAIVVKLARSRLLALLLFAGLSLNPVLWYGSLARVIREGLYIGLGLGIIALLASLIALALSSVRSRREKTLVLGVLLGCVLGAFWMTREEGLWIVPSLAVLAGAGFVAALVATRGRVIDGASAYLSGQVPALVVSVAIAAIAVLSVSALNWKHYGVFADVEFKAKGFVAAYGALSRVPHEQWHRYVLFPHDARERAYAVSPAAAELRPALQGKIGSGWRDLGCANQGLQPCPDILAGWFMWALRDAVAYAGHYQSGAAAEAFYGRLAQEINEACRSGALAGCLPERETLQPPFRSQYIGDTLAMIPQMGSLLLRFTNDSAGAPSSSGSADMIALFRTLVGPVAPTESERAVSNDSRGVADAVASRRTQLMARIAAKIAAIYSASMPWLFGTGLAGIAVLLLRSRRDPRGLVLGAIGAAAAVAVASRVTLLSYLQVTTIPALATLYLSPATPFVIVVAILGNWALVTAAIAFVSERRERALGRT
jgi:hypothetical protein